MVEIQAKEVIDKISEDLKVQPAMTVPRTLSKDIQLSYNVNPERLIKVASASANDATSATIHTTHATKDTYLVGASLTVAKSVLVISIFSTIKCFPFGESAALEVMRLRYEPLTAGDTAMAQTFPPIKLERGSIISVTNGNAVPSIDATGFVFFYEVDPQ